MILQDINIHCNFKITFDESMNKRHWSGLYSWPRTSITEQTYLQNKTPSSREKKSLNTSWRPQQKHTLVSWRRSFQLFNLERKAWMKQKFWKHIWIQHPKIHQKQTFFLNGFLLASVMWASPSLTALQLIQYIYMHTYSVHLSLSYSTLWYKRPTLTQEHLEALWPIDTTKLQTETTPFCYCC